MGVMALFHLQKMFPFRYFLLKKIDLSLFSTSFFAKYLCVVEDGPGRGHLCHTDTFLVSSYMGMVAIFFNDAERFEQIDNTPSTEGSMLNLVKIGQAVSEKKMFKDYEILYMYIAQGQGQITPGTKIWLFLKGCATLIIHCKLQPLVFNTFWESEFSIFPLQMHRDANLILP